MTCLLWDMNRWIYDVEVYRNIFTVTFKNYDTQKVIVFEISERKNQYCELIEFLKTNPFLIGFNCKYYDNIILNVLNKHYIQYKEERNFLVITSYLKDISEALIVTEDYNVYKKYKYNFPLKYIDLFLYWSKMLRQSKKLSLKSIAINMNWPIVMELPIDSNEDVELEDIDYLLYYNLNDVNITEELCKRKKEDINLRIAAQKRYKLDCLNWDGVKLGLNILVKRYSDRTNIPIDTVQNLRTVRESVKISEILLPIIKFKENDISYRTFIEEGKTFFSFKSPLGVLKYLNTLNVTNTSQINCRLFYNDTIYDIMSGGIHSVHTGDIQVRKEGFIYEDIDVSSYYPSLGAEHKFIPEHLGIEFAEELGSIKNERLELKAKGLGKSNDAELLKLSMNGGFFGNTNNEYTPMQDLKCFLSITLNGQLLLLMLAEWINDIGGHIDMANTDGLTIIYPENKREEVLELRKKWEELTNFELEEVAYKKVVRNNINNYLALSEDNKVKEKGMFLTNPPLDMSRDALVIPKALQAYFLQGVDVETFIRNHNNIYDFCIAQKCDKKFEVFWNGKKFAL